jgi:hypothetical protein
VFIGARGVACPSGQGVQTTTGPGPEALRGSHAGAHGGHSADGDAPRRKTT